jgi:hypothetical protein
MEVKISYETKDSVIMAALYYNTENNSLKRKSVFCEIWSDFLNVI